MPVAEALWECPECGSGNVRIPPERRYRAFRKDGFVHRRRKCVDCGHVQPTVEMPLINAAGLLRLNGNI